MRRPGLRFASSTLALSLAAVFAAACDGVGTGGLTGRDLGILAFEREVGGLACADCHGESAAPRPSPDWVLPGRPLGGVALRPTLWGGRFEGGIALFQAVEFCSSRFQYRVREENGEAGWLHDPDDLGALVEYLGTFPGPDAALPLRRTDDVDAALDTAGDPDRGEAVWARSCAVCHGDEAEGGLAPALDGIDTPDPFTLADAVRQGADVDDVNVWMPWFTTDDLSTQDLADLIARYAE